MHILKMPKLPKNVKKFVTAAASRDSNRPYLTWLHAKCGYLYAADGYRVHMVRTGTPDEGAIKLPKSVPSEETSRVWDYIKAQIDIPRISATVNTGVLLAQAQRLIDRGNPSHRNWFETTMIPDPASMVMSLMPHRRRHGLLGIVPMESMGDDGFKANIDIRYIPSALSVFDTAEPVQITFPPTTADPIRFQQGDYITLIMPMGD